MCQETHTAKQKKLYDDYVDAIHNIQLKHTYIYMKKVFDKYCHVEMVQMNFWLWKNVCLIKL